MKYWIIDLEGFGMSENTKEARGPFKSIAAAEEWLKNDAMENFNSLNLSEPVKIGEHDGWAAPVLIVEEKKKIQQVPVVDFEINLKKIK